MSVFRGQAAFQWSDTDDTMTQRVLLLREPVREIRAAHAQSVFPSDSLDYSVRQVFTIGQGVDELVARVRFGDDPQGLVDLLKAGTKLRTITYVPDLRDPAQSFACYLISPLSPVALGLDPESGVSFGDQEVELRLRRTTGKPFQAGFANPTLFSFRAGGRIREGTFSRAGVASYAANTHAKGTLTTAASGAARLFWFSTASSVGPRNVPALMLEEQRTNLVKQSENFASTTWTKTSVTITSAQADPRGGTNAHLLIDASTTVQGELKQTITIASATRATISSWFRKGTTSSTGETLRLLTSTGAVKIRGTIIWSSGRPTFSASVGTFIQSQAWRDGWWRASWRSTGNLTTGSYVISYASASPAAAKWNLYIFGAQVEQ